MHGDSSRHSPLMHNNSDHPTLQSLLAPMYLVRRSKYIYVQVNIHSMVLPRQNRHIVIRPKFRNIEYWNGAAVKPLQHCNYIGLNASIYVMKQH